MEEKANKQFFTWLLQDLCKQVGKLDTSKLFSGGGEEETEGKEEKVTVGKLRLVNWEAANKEETGEVKREVVKVNPDSQVSQKNSSLSSH